MDDKVRVIFRRWEDTEEALALFPDLPSDYAGKFCVVIGCRGLADMHVTRLVMQATIPANLTDADVMALKAELERVGYTLEVVNPETN